MTPLFENELEVHRLGTSVYLCDDGLYRGAYYWGERFRFNDIGEPTIVRALFALHGTMESIKRVAKLAKLINENAGNP